MAKPQPLKRIPVDDGPSPDPSRAAEDAAGDVPGKVVTDLANSESPARRAHRLRKKAVLAALKPAS